MHLWFLLGAILHSSLYWTWERFIVPLAVIVTISHRNPFRSLICYVIQNLCLKIRFVQVAFANPHSQPPNLPTMEDSNPNLSQLPFVPRLWASFITVPVTKTNSPRTLKLIVHSFQSNSVSTRVIVLSKPVGL